MRRLVEEKLAGWLSGAREGKIIAGEFQEMEFEEVELSQTSKVMTTTQQDIDEKAREEDVLFHDGSIPLSGDWEIGSYSITKNGKDIACPTYIYIKATSQAEGDLHLSDGTNWATSKALIKLIRVVTSATDWDLYILQNDNGHAANDATIPELQIMEAGNGNAAILLDLPYEDEDDSDEVHLYYLDNSGANTADIYIIAIEMQ